jgi:hypothetical protein
MFFVCRESHCPTLRGENLGFSKEIIFIADFLNPWANARSTRIFTSWMSGGGVLIGIIIGVNGRGVMGVVWNSELQIKVESSPNGVYHDAFMAA